MLLALWPAPAGTRANLVILALAVAGGTGVFWGTSVLLGAPERATLAAILPRRRRG
jgi:hypothetical protein